MEYKKRTDSDTSFVLFKWKTIKTVLCQEQQILNYDKASQNHKNQEGTGEERSHTHEKEKLSAMEKAEAVAATMALNPQKETPSFSRAAQGVSCQSSQAVEPPDSGGLETRIW